MKLLSVFYGTRKSLLLILPLLLLGSYAVHEAVGRSGGITGQSKIGCGTLNNGCHSDSKSSATVVSLSTESSQIVAGQTYIFRISVANADPSEVAAGCDITADKGTLATNGYGSGLQAYYGDLTHTSPRYFTGDSAVWTFQYTAPAKTGPTHIYAAGNAVNRDYAADAQDHWNLAIDTLTIVSSGVTPETNPSADIHIVPNPSVTGRFTLIATGWTGPSELAVSDPAGRVLLRKSPLLASESPLDLSALPNGTYFVSIRSKDGQSFVKRVLIDR
ncbi:MAG TPA: T9SS type A sorting domain-containing protein [Candidatus Kapabacteria bacterium]|nr:T9SS type A sorting domain-containing protein [Candidatus Kapabacteria bacterium]